MFAGTLDSDLCHVVVDHELDELFESGLLCWVPAELLLRLSRIAPEVDNVGRAVEVR